MICKYYLMIGSDSVDRNSESCIDVSAMISNLKDLKLSYSRVDYGGVTRKSGSSIEFIGDARERIIDYFMSNGVNSLASFAVYAIEDDWTYKEIFSCPLDFSSFSYDLYVAKLSCLDNSIAAKIKANNNTKYEFNVSELKAPKQLAYDRVSMRNEASIQAIGNKQTGNDTYTELKPDVWWYYPRIGIIDTNLVNNESILLQDSPETFQTDGTPLIWGMPGLNKTDVYFLECLKDCTVSIDFSNIGIGSYGCVLAKISGSSSTPLNCGYSNVMSKDENTIGNFKWSGALLKGEKLQFAIYNYTHGRPGYSTNIFFEANKKGYILWDERQSPYYFDAIKPDVLLDKIISSMCPGMDVRTYIKESITNANGVEIDNPSIKNVVLCPAECVRQISDAKIYTSFSDFCQWMEDTFGYVYQIVEMAENEDEFLLPNIYDFYGFAESSQLGVADDDEPIKSIVFWTDSDETQPSRKKGQFAGEYDWVIDGIPGTEPSIQIAYSSEFPEQENYQVKDYGGDPVGTKVHTDRYFRDTKNFVLYYAVNKTRPSYTAGAQYYRSGHPVMGKEHFSELFIQLFLSVSDPYPDIAQGQPHQFLCVPFFHFHGDQRRRKVCHLMPALPGKPVSVPRRACGRIGNPSCSDDHRVCRDRPPGRKTDSFRPSILRKYLFYFCPEAYPDPKPLHLLLQRADHIRGMVRFREDPASSFHFCLHSQFLKKSDDLIICETVKAAV